MPAIKKYVATIQEAEKSGQTRLITDSIHATDYDTAKKFFGKRWGHDNIIALVQEPPPFKGKQ